MGRTATPKKQQIVSRTLSARPSPALSPAPTNNSSKAPSRASSTASSQAEDTPRPAGSSKKSRHPASALPHHMKRPVEDSPAAASESLQPPPRKKPRKPKKPKAERDALKLAKASGLSIKGGAAGQEADKGEVEGDFSDLFFMDSAPSAVPEESVYVEGAVDDPPAGATAQEEKARQKAQEDEDMRVFAAEVAMSDSEESSDDSDDDEDGPTALPYAEDVMYEDEEALQEAIRGKIVDDSAAKVTGRYYKEADLTKSCALCGEQGHSSRDCTHSQCFICGLVDSDHEARNCPVALVCSACGSRGHFGRDCMNAAPMRGPNYGARCSLCSSGNHLSVNCPTLWRVYDTTGAKPVKRKIVFACANDGTTRDHFIDDCLLPRGHPMRFADPSAFNRAALGDAAIGLPGPSSARGGGGATGASSAARRRGGERGERHFQPEEPADDDWFASRDRRGGGGGGSGSGRNTPRGGGGSGGGDRFRPSGGGGGQDSARRTHIHFNDSNQDRFGGSPAPRGGDSGRRGHRDDDRGSGRDDRDTWRSMYGDDDRRGGGRSGGGGGGGGGGSRGRSGWDSGKDSGRDSGRSTPSLMSRIEGNSGKSGGKPKPRYQGGYY